MKLRIAFLMFLVLGFGLPNVSAQTNAPSKITGGILNGKAKSLPKPAYPAAARAVNASGAVSVQVTIDEQGNVVSASAVSGHPLLRQAAEQAARAATFSPTLLSGQPVSVTGVLVYNFVGSSNESGEKPSAAQKWSVDGVLLGFAQAKGIKGKINLPEGFSGEQEQLNGIINLPLEEQKAQIPTIVSLIKSKLSPVDLWRFEFGLAKGAIFSSTDDNSILSGLAKFRELAMNKAEGVQESEIKQAAELAKYADKGSLTAEDKQAIFSYLK